jgi:p-methyltransferase
MSDLDVVIIGAFSLTEKAGGGEETMKKMRLHYKNTPATVDFLKTLVECKGNLGVTEKQYAQADRSKFVARSLNTIYLYDFLTKNNITTEVVSYFLLEQDRFKELMSYKPKVVAISTTFISDAPDIITIAKAVKELSPESVIFAGGIKVLKSYKKLMLFNQNYFDGYDVESIKKNNFFFNPEIDKHINVFVIEESGELTLLDLIRKIQKGKSYKLTPNIAYRDGNELIFTKRVKEPYAFEHNPIAWDKIPEEILGQEIPVRAGIRCPYKCAFCDFTGLHSNVRIRAIDSLIEELKLIQNRFPGKPVFFTDDNLFTTRKRTRELAEAIVKNGLRFKWRAFMRADAITEENAEVLARSGCYMAYLGVESGDEQILKNMKKRTARDQTLKAVTRLYKDGINTMSTIIIGFPGETKDSVDKTINLLNAYPDTEEAINKYYPFTFFLFPLAPISSPQNRERFMIGGGAESWYHSTMDFIEAREQLFRCFKDIEVPTFGYPEYIDYRIPLTKIKKVSKARENIVKGGINVIDESNVEEIYSEFAAILRPE